MANVEAADVVVDGTGTATQTARQAPNQRRTPSRIPPMLSQSFPAN
jgi:hypothetical protein